MPPDNSERLTKGIVNILSGEDKGRTEVGEMIEKGFKKALSLNWDYVSEATTGVYANVLASAQALTSVKTQGKDVGIGIETGEGEIWKYSYS